MANSSERLYPMEAQEAVHALTEHLLGKSYYIADPVTGKQANAIIVDEIRSRYPAVDEDPVYKYRRTHKKCKWCSYYRNHNCTCVAKDKDVNPELPRLFCTLFKLTNVRY